MARAFLLVGVALSLAGCAVGDDDIACGQDAHCPGGRHCAPEGRCAAGERSPLALCTPRTGAGPQCACPAGHDGDGVWCADVDECARGTAGCAPDAECTNVPGSFRCACRLFFEGDGRTCTPLDREQPRWAHGADARAGTEFEIGDGTVRDKVTGLLWQRAPAAGTHTRDEGAALCEALALGGLAGWRLPTRLELSSLADRTLGPPAIAAAAFPQTPAADFWTATARSGEPGRGWLVDFTQGRVHSAQTGSVAHVRCVRVPLSVAVPPPARFTADESTVRDHRTGLVWGRAVEPGKHYGTQAETDCDRAVIGGEGGWRLPTVRELETLVNPAASPPVHAVLSPPSDYPGSPYGQFWSATGDADSSGAAWTVDFGSGAVWVSGRSYAFNVRCVR